MFDSLRYMILLIIYGSKRADRYRQRLSGLIEWVGRHCAKVYRSVVRRFANLSRWWAAAVPMLAVVLASLLVFGLGSLEVFSGEAKRRLEVHGYSNLDPVSYRLSYPVMAGLLVEGHVVPGLHANFVPQGIDFLPDESTRAVLSGYFCQRFQRAPLRQGLISLCSQKQSALYLVDLEAGKALRLAMLEERDGEPMRRHAGGIAVLHDRLWLPDTFEVLRFDLSKLVDSWSKTITLKPENKERIGIDSSGDFITAKGDSLWIGNFQRASRGAPLPRHYRSLGGGTAGWTAAYRIDPKTLRPVNTEQYTVHFAGKPYEVYRPDAGLHHRSLVQGMTFIDERRIVLSTSWGNAPSAFNFHRLPDNPLEADHDDVPLVELPDGSEIPVWAVLPATREMQIFAPPGAEGIAFDGQLLLTVFEGGALPYRERWGHIEDRMILFQPPGVTRRGTPIVPLVAPKSSQ